MISFKQINVLDYLCNYSKTFPVSLNFYMDKVTSSEYEDMLLLASQNAYACGLAFAYKKHDTFTIYLISIHPDFCNQSIDKILLDRCLHTAQESGSVFVDYYYNCCKWQQQQDEILNRGFQEKSHMVHYEMFTTDTNGEEWAHFLKYRGSRILRRLTSKGFCTTTLEKIQPSVLDNMYSQIGTQFPADLDPRNCKYVIREFSAITLYQNEPVAFLIVTTENRGKTVRVEQLSVRSDFHNRGVFFLPLYFFINKAMNENVSSVTFLVNCRNNAMIKLADGFLSFTDAKKFQNYVYHCKIPEIL